MCKEKKWMDCLDSLSTEDKQLTDAELDRLTRQVLRRTGRSGKTKPRHRIRRWWPVWGKVLAGGAACVALLAGINGINPALAESFPVLGNVFAYINALPKGYLQSEQLGEHAQSVQIEAEPGTPSQENDASSTLPPQEEAKEQPYNLILSQVYCDELYLRVGLILTAQDDSLANFDAVTLHPPLLWEDTAQGEVDTLYGGVTLNGETVGGDLVPCFRKQDDHTFVCEMDYNLQNYTGNTQDMQASLTFSHLVGVVDGSEEETPLAGSYKIDFTVSADGTLSREGQIQGGEQNGIRLVSLKATPGETCLEYTAESLPAEAVPYPRIFTEDGTALEWVKEIPQEDAEQGRTSWKCYFEAVPEGVTRLQVQMVDKNTSELAVLAEWTVTLPQ